MSKVAEPRLTNMRLTHRQIAEELGVSRQLVGFALRGEGRMSDEIRRQILEVAQRNGYDQYSNREARSLAARRYGKRAATGVLAVIFQSTFEGEPISTVPFFTPLFEGLETEAIHQGVDLALCALRPDQLPRLVRENQVDGIVCIGTPQEDVERLLETGLPVVNVFEVAGCDLDLVIDNEAGMTQVTRHLIGLGHRKIAYLGSDFRLSDERLQIFRRELEAVGAMNDSLVVTAQCKLSINAGAALIQQFLEKHGLQNAPASRPLPFSALVAFNDLMAIGAIQALQAAGYEVPGDVSVVGFDDVSLHYPFAPALTSVRFSRRDMGRRAIEFLCQRTQARDRHDTEATPQCEVFPVEFVPRDSTGALQH